jgi:trans-aconitate 2-methyltransferase
VSWEPGRYSRYEEERNRPALDLIHAVGPGPFRLAVDLGCGPGNSTEALAEAYRQTEIRAVDSDPAMVQAARARLPGIAVEQADLSRWTPPEGVDLLFSNAVFHWLPDHLPLLARFVSTLSPGGVLALQMPDNLSEPTHRLMGETALADPFAAAFPDGLPARAPLPAPRDYVDALSAAGAAVTIWRTTYHHRFADASGIVDFVAGAGLRPYAQAIRERLGDAAHDAYLARYQRAVAEAYPPLADGSVLMAMPRLFVVGRV